MRGRQVGVLGAGLVAIGLALMMVGSVVGPLAGYGPGAGYGAGYGMMRPGGMMNWGPAPTAPAGTSVRMAGSRFDPPTLTVAAGTTVRWFNDDNVAHTVTASDDSWDSGDLPPGGGFERRFDSSGTYAYLCRYHPGMTGTIVVEAP